MHTLPRFGLDIDLVDPDRPGELPPRDQAEHQAALRRDRRQPQARHAGHRGRGGDRARGRHPADRRQHDGDAVPHPARSTTAPTSSCTRRPSSSAATARPSAAWSSTRASSTGRRTTSSPASCEPDASYHGLKFYEALGPITYIVKLRVSLLRDIGAALSPFNAFLFLQGLETLHLRMERHSVNALRRGRVPARSTPRSTWVSYPGLECHPTHGLACKYHYRGLFGAIVGFGIAGRPRGGPALRREHAAALAPGQHRRRQVARHPPGDDDALAADRRGAARDRRHRRLRAAQHRHRVARGHHRRHRPGAGQGLTSAPGGGGRADAAGEGPAGPPRAPHRRSARIMDAMTEKKPAARKEIGDVAMGLRRRRRQRRRRPHPATSRSTSPARSSPSRAAARWRRSRSPTRPTAR